MLKNQYKPKSSLACILSAYVAIYIFLVAVNFNNWSVFPYNIVVFIPFGFLLFKFLKSPILKQVKIIANRLVLSSSWFFKRTTIEINIDTLKKISHHTTDFCFKGVYFYYSEKQKYFIISNKNQMKIFEILNQLAIPVYYQTTKNETYIRTIETSNNKLTLQLINEMKTNSIEFSFDDIKAINLTKPYFSEMSWGEVFIYIDENTMYYYKFYKGLDNKVYNALVAVKKELGLYYD
jgi:hypothetical protein